MNKSDLISRVADEADLTKIQAEGALNAVIENITNSLAGGDKVGLTGFLTLTPVQKAERMARNPKTNENVVVPARTAVKMTLGKALKDRLNPNL